MASKSPDLTGDVIHWGVVRMRVTGFGNLNLALRSLQNVENENLQNIPMTPSTGTEPTVLALFVNQRAQLDISVNELGDAFNISKIYIYIKSIASSYPM